MPPLSGKLAARVGAAKGLPALIASLDEGSLSTEAFVVRFVTAVRSDGDAPVTEREVVHGARRRLRRARIAAIAAGLFAGAANQMVDLYCETATVCEVVALDGLDASDERIAACMLVLWGVADDLAAGEAMLAGRGPSIASALTTRFAAASEGWVPDTSSKRAVLKALWRSRTLASDLRKKATRGTFTGVFAAGGHVKQLVARARLVLTADEQPALAAPAR